MFENVGTLLTDPNRFFEERRRDPSLVEPALLVLAIAIFSAISVAVTLLVFVETLSSDVEIFFIIGGIFGGLIAVVSPFVSWLLYAVAFQVLTYFFDGEGEFRDTFALTGWGFAPRLLAVIVSLVITVYLTQSIHIPVDPAAYQDFSNRIATHPLNLTASGLSIVFTLWSAYIWIPAVQQARNVTRGQATIAVGVPVLVAILITVGSLLVSVLAQGMV